MGGAASRQQLLGPRHFEVLLQTGNHHDHQWRTQRHGPGFVQRRLGHFAPCNCTASTNSSPKRSRASPSTVRKRQGRSWP